MSGDARPLLTRRQDFDIWEVLWRLFASSQLTVLLLSVLALFLVLSLFLSSIAPGLPEGHDALLQGLGSFNLRRVPNAILLRLIMGALALNSLVGVADRWPISWRRLRAPFPATPEWNIGQVTLVETILPASTEQAITSLRDVLERQGFSCQVRADEREGGIYTWAADRFPWAWAVSLLLPLGALLLLLGLALTGSLAWREEGIALAPGQTRQLRHTALALRLDEMEPGAPYEGYSHLSLLLGENVVRTGSVRPGHTFNAFSLTVFQAGYRPAVRLRVTDKAGSPLALQIFPTNPSFSAAPRLSFPAERGEGYFALPDHALSFRLVFYSSLPEQGIAGPIFLVEIYEADDLDPSYRTFARPGDSVSYEGVLCELTMDHDAVLGATWDPGSWVILPGTILLLLGLLFSYVVSPVKLWGSVRPAPSGDEGSADAGEAGGGTVVTMFGESTALRQQLERLADRLKECPVSAQTYPEGPVPGGDEERQNDS